MRVIVTGDRHWRCREIADHIAHRLRERYGVDLVIVHGGAPGVDAAFHDACMVLGVAVEPHPADWEAYGRGAGPRRNQEMIDAEADLCIAVHRNLEQSRGTRDCVRRCIAAGIPVWLIDSDDMRPRQIYHGDPRPTRDPA